MEHSPGIALGHCVLITGVSGYIGGTLMARLADKLPLNSCDEIYSLVRTDSQANAVRTHYPDVRPLSFDMHNADAVRASLIKHRISVVFFLNDSLHVTAQTNFMHALVAVRDATGLDVHFLHTSGAKIFSSHAGAPIDRQFFDDEPDVYMIQKTQQPTSDLMGEAVATNNTIVELGETLGVRTYIVVPCIVYGEGEGFGNRISIQTVAIVRAAKATRGVYKVDTGRPSWPVCHVCDTASLYEALLVAILGSVLGGAEPPHGRNGYYLAASGSVVWDDLYTVMGRALAKHGVVPGTYIGKEIPQADDATIEVMAQALGCPKELVPVNIGGHCMFTARNGQSVDWHPVYEPEHILETAEEEVDLILANLDKS